MTTTIASVFFDGDEMPVSEFIEYRGERFYVQSTGRYFQSGNKKSLERLLHRRVWSDANGPIPDGCEIHHKDENWRNNDLENLEVVNAVEHQRAHMLAKMADPALRQAAVDALATGREKAAEWHRSDAGREWHKRHASRAWEAREPVDKDCIICGSTYKTFFPTRSRFCSVTCEQKDHYERHKTAFGVCAMCGSEFTYNKFRSQECCSRTCGNRLRAKRAKEQKEST